MTHDTADEPPSLLRDELLNVLRRIADYDAAPKTVQADARDYLQSLEAAAFGPHAREVAALLPRPRRGS